MPQLVALLDGAVGVRTVKIGTYLIGKFLRHRHPADSDQHLLAHPCGAATAATNMIAAALIFKFCKRQLPWKPTRNLTPDSNRELS
jgi:hypothetical protein